MRNAFIDTLFEIATHDQRVVLVVGDLGFGVVEKFRKALPNQFVNAGVAEQHMTSLAAGLAMSGKVVFTYSIANFPVIRCLEQIRNDVCYHDANVRIVAVGGGLSYGSLGPSHHATEDLAIMRALPNMLVVAPADPVETREAVRALIEHKGPAYLRLGRAGDTIVHEKGIDFRLGRGVTVRNGNDLTLVATGALVPEAMKAADILAKEGMEARVLSVHTLKPFDEEIVLLAAAETPMLVTIEEHSVIGGLGGAVAETLQEGGAPSIVFRRIGLKSSFSSQVGDQTYLRSHYGLDAKGIVGTVRRLLEENEALASAAKSRPHRS